MEKKLNEIEGSRFAKIMRVITVAPVMSLILFSILFGVGAVFANVWEYLAAVLFLTVVPLLAYPLQKVLPKFKNTGRHGQRVLAMIMANVGYILSIIYALTFKVSSELMRVFLTYLISGALIFILSMVFSFKASGHACGLMGPVAVLAYYVGEINISMGIITVILGLILFGIVFWCSLRIKRHTASQYIVGAVIPVITFAVLNFLA